MKAFQDYDITGTVPKEFNGWELMDPGSLVTLWSQVGEIVFDDHTWTIGRSEQVLCLYLFTDIPHPDEATKSCIFQRILDPVISELASHLVGAVLGMEDRV